VAANGGSDNAFTSYDYTAYFQRVAADRLPLMMQMESDRMNNLRLTEGDIATEREVILEERAQRTDNNPGALAREQIAAAQYLNHRYGVPIIGWRHEMETLSLEDAQAWYDLYYSPNNAVLVVAGDVEPEAVRALATQYYGAIPAEPDLPQRLRSEEPPQTAERRVIFVDPRVSQAYVTRSYLAPERDPGAQTEAAALVYLSELLGGSPFNSVLGVALQFDTQTAVFTGAGYSGNSLDDTTFSLTVAPAEGISLSAAEAAMDKAVADFMAAGVDPVQLDRIRTRLRASEIYAKDDVQGLAQRYGAALSEGLTVQDVQDWPAILQAVTAEDIMAVATKVLDRRRSVTGWIVSDQEDAR
jgi:zinc protease